MSSQVYNRTEKMDEEVKKKASNGGNGPREASSGRMPAGEPRASTNRQGTAPLTTIRLCELYMVRIQREELTNNLLKKGHFMMEPARAPILQEHQLLFPPSCKIQTLAYWFFVLDAAAPSRPAASATRHISES